MSAMSDYAIYCASLDFVALDDVGCNCAQCNDSHCGDWRIGPDNRLLCESCFNEEYFTCCDCDEITPNDEATTYGDGQLCESCSQNYFTCEHCDELTPDCDVTRLLCESCFNEEYFTCCDCDEITPNDEATTYGDGQLCESCSQNYFTCEHCDELTPDCDVTTVDDESWCPSCRRNNASHCSDCGCWTHDDNVVSCGHGSVCECCYEDSYFTCDECSEVCHNDDYGEDGHCQACSPDHDTDSIMDYSTDVLDALGIRVDRKKLLYGIELEVTTPHDRDEAAQECRESLGENYCIAKHDGSLGAGGFELVTIPDSLKAHTRRWSEFLDSPPAGLRSWAGGTCGMHVHVSRKPLSLLTVGKLLVFINATENNGLVTSIAGRTSNQWAEISPKNIVDAKKPSDNRYEAINLCNCDTIEFRIFRGTLKKSAFLKNLEFVVATVAFCQQAGIHGLDVPSFLAWFRSVRKDYLNLDAWLTSHGYIKARSKPVKAHSTKGGN